VVAIDGQLRVGEAAAQLLIKPGVAIAEVKRLMGTDQTVTLAGERYTPQEISAIILRHLKQEAEKFLGEPVTEAVVTVPAYFGVLERRATKDATELAGLKLRRLINEPTAAALAYGIERPHVEEKVLVYDLGGGTFDVTVLELSEGILDVLASTGNHQLGGKDFDERVMEHLRAECLRLTGVDLEAGPQQNLRLRLKGRLKAAAKRAKEELSSVESTHILLDIIAIGADGTPVDFEYTLTRPVFDELIRDLVESTRQQLDEALAAKGLWPSDIDTILMVGGSTRIPLVRDFVSEYFGGRQLRTEVSPDEAVALGAAILSGIESRIIDPEDLLITDVSALTLGVAVLEEQDGEMKSDVFDPLIHKNETIPRTKKKRYATAFDGQETVAIRVYQGDAPTCSDNRKVGELHLELSPPAPAGQPIEVEFSYDLSGDLDVSALDLRTGRSVRAIMHPMPERMSGDERRTARDRLDTLWAGSRTHESPEPTRGPTAPSRTTAGSEPWQSSTLYFRVAGLMRHAEKRLPELSPEFRSRVQQLLNDMKAALVREDEHAVARSERELTDVLFDLA